MKTNYTFTRGATNTIIPSLFLILGKIYNLYIWPPTILNLTLPGYGRGWNLAAKLLICMGSPLLKKIEKVWQLSWNRGFEVLKKQKFTFKYKMTLTLLPAGSKIYVNWWGGPLLFLRIRQYLAQKMIKPSSPIYLRTLYLESMTL